MINAKRGYYSPFLLHLLFQGIKMKKRISILILFFLSFSSLFCFIGCDEGFEGLKNHTTRTKTVSYQHFNTVTTISAYGNTSQAEFESYVKIADETFGYYHKLFDIYYEYSGVNNIRTINRKAGKSPVQVDGELIDFLLYCKELYTVTKGKTNIMLGSVLSIWHDVREIADENGGVLLDKSKLPTEAELKEAAKHTSIDSLIINKEEKTVYISDPDASIDVGAIAKGYAAAKLAEKLKSLGADSMAINAGGNIVTIGVKPTGENWEVGITNPNKDSFNSLICKVVIGETALVTSGDYERYFVCEGVSYHHIIDPETLMPADYFASVSIFTEDSGLADALSTALFCMSQEEGLALVNGLGNVQVLWIDKNGKMTYTDGLKNLIKEIK